MSSKGQVESSASSPLKILDASEPRQSGKESKIAVNLKEGITSEDAKKISKLIRD
jgi:uncharacterized protein YajQ (UPF0234 family)